MSVNRYNASTGELTNLASGSRVWTGTKAAYDAQKAAGTLPTNAIICITDDEVDTCHYSTEETFTGMYWIDGKPIYRKVIDCGGLTTKNVPHGITNLDNFTHIDGFTRSGNSTKATMVVPLVSSTSIIVYIRATVQNVELNATDDYSSNYPYTYITLEYTKTTD